MAHLPNMPDGLNTLSVMKSLHGWPDTRLMVSASTVYPRLEDSLVSWHEAERHGISGPDQLGIALHAERIEAGASRTRPAV